MLGAERWKDAKATQANHPPQVSPARRVDALRVESPKRLPGIKLRGSSNGGSGVS
jgi:hypothetical protein